MTNEMRKLLILFDRTVLDNWNRDGSWTCVEDVKPHLLRVCKSFGLADVAIKLTDEVVKLAYKTGLYEGVSVIEGVPAWVRPREEK